LQTFLETQRQYLSTARSINQARMQDIAAELDMELLSGKGPLAASGGKP
jgi:hypothetical protein